MPQTTTPNPDGSVTMTDEDGTETTSYPDGTITKVLPDGSVQTSYPDGQSQAVSEGTKTNPDGSITKTEADGTQTTSYPDGTITKVLPDGSVQTSYPDGQSEAVSEGTKTNPDGSITKTEADGTQTTSYPDGTITKVGPDGSVHTSYPDGTSGTGGPTDGTVTYDENGNVVKKSGPDAWMDEDGNITRYEYDENGELKKVENPDGSVEQQNPDGSWTKYDANGQSIGSPQSKPPTTPQQQPVKKPQPKPKPPPPPTHSWRAKQGHPCYIATTKEKCSLFVEVDAPIDDSNTLDRFEVEVTPVNPSGGPKSPDERKSLAPDREQFIFRDLDAGWYTITLLAKDASGGKAPASTQQAEVVPSPSGRAPNEEPLRFVAHDPPNLGQIHMQLFDQFGNAALASRSYSISGEKSLSGTTDARGVLRHRRVPAGKYTLTIDGATEQSAAIVLSPFDPIPQIRFLE